VPALLAAAMLWICPALQEPKDEPKPPPQETPAEEPESLGFQGELRIGGWRTGAFDAVTPLGRRTINTTLLFDAGFDFRAISSGWSLTLTGDYAAGKSITLETAGILIGTMWELESDPLPLDLQVAIGPVLGSLKVDVAGFGSFRNAVGFEARIAATSWVDGRIGISFWLDYRQISYTYLGTVTSGDLHAGGPSFALGLGIVMRF